MRSLLQSADPNVWTLISAVIFGLMFVVLCIWVYLPMRKKEYSKAEKLPLEE